MTTPTTSKSILKRGALIAGAATLGIGLAAGLADGALMQNHSAFAQPIQLSGVQTQLPSFADMVDHVKPAVVSVRVKTSVAAASAEDGESGIEGLPPGHPLERFLRRFGEEGQGQGQGQGPRQGKPQPRQGMSQGSGFFVSQDGYVVTNNHVVQNATEVQLVTDSGKTLAAKVIGTDPRTDIALLKVTEEGNYPFVQLAKTKPRIGDWVLAVGNPFGLGGTVTAGIVSASGRDIGNGPYDDFIQIDAPVNKGNSGGPAFDTNGEVMGVNTAIYSPSGGSVGIAFSIPASTVKSVVAQLKDKGSVSRGWIGVQIQPVTSDIADSLGMKKAEGALVAEPQVNGPAAKAGIESGDVITSVNGESVKDARELARTIGGLAPGATVKLNVLHKGQDKVVNLTLGQLPNTIEAKADIDKDSGKGASRGTDVPKLGMTVAPADSVAGAGKEGVVITEVDPKSAAAERGFKEGDVILEVGGKSVSTAGEVRDAINTARTDNKNSVLMRVKSGGQSRFVAVPIAKG